MTKPHFCHVKKVRRKAANLGSPDLRSPIGRMTVKMRLRLLPAEVAGEPAPGRFAQVGAVAPRSFAPAWTGAPEGEVGHRREAMRRRLVQSDQR